jgi:hypothetical protein
VPLYPGFRGSVFAIIKQPQNPGPHSPIVTIRGKVLGIQVVFKTQVNPIAFRSDVVSGVMKSSKLLHILAAKALIELYDDMPSSPEATAQIERLQKRYSLATSVSSFLAIDKELRSETRTLFTEKATGRDSHKSSFSGSAMWRATLAGGLSTQSTATFTPQSTVSSSTIAHSSYDPPQRPRLLTLRSSPTAPSDSAEGYLSTPFGFVRARSLGTNDASSSLIAASMLDQAGFGPTISPSKVYSFGGNQYGTIRALPPNCDMTVDDAQLIRDNVSGHLEHGESYESPTNESDFLSLSPSFTFDFASKKKSNVPPPLPDHNSLSAAIASAPENPPVLTSYSTFTNSVPASVGPITLELVARLQKFDGSFTSDPAFLARVCENRPFSSMPSILSALRVKGRDDALKITDEIWVTVLTLAYLKYAFVLEKESWEIMAEKATTFIETALKTMFPATDYAQVHAALVADAGTEF